MYCVPYKSEGVRRLQIALKEAGLLAGDSDGKFGNNTQKAVKAWQKNNGRKPTGTADLPVLRGLGLIPPVCSTDVEDVGIWIDKWPKAGAEGDFAAKWQKSKITSASICMWNAMSADTFWRLRPGCDKARFVNLSRALQDAGISVGWCFWGDRKNIDNQLRALENQLQRYTDLAEDETLAPKWIELDLEEQWRGATAQDAHHLAAGLVDMGFLEVRINFVYRGDIAEGIAAFFTEPGMTEATLQAYTAYLKPGAAEHWTHDVQFRPGGSYLQTCLDEGATKIFQVAPDLTVRMGLAVYGQNHPAPFAKGTAALQESWEVAQASPVWRKNNPGRYRFWSAGNATATIREWMSSLLA